MIFLLGCNHRSAPVSFRERLAVEPSAIRPVLDDLRCIDGVEEAMLLSTCNRVELILRAEPKRAQGVMPAVEAYICQRNGIEPEDLQRHAYRFHGRDAVRHLFRVASGLDSMILGEPQILGQVKQAYHLAREHGAVGPVIDRLAQSGFATAKRARTETGISRQPVSVAYSAVELARSIFGDLHGRSALLLGAGKMSDLIARHLQGSGVGRLLVSSRTYTRAAEAAERVDGEPRNWEDGLASIGEVDIVVGATGAMEPILTRSIVAQAMKKRRGRALFLIDIAVPRDIEPGVNELNNVYLYDIDALQDVIDANIGERQRAAEEAEHLVDGEVDNFELWRQSQSVGPVIAEIRDTALAVGRSEIERLHRKLGTLDATQRQGVEEVVRAVVQKLLHRPIRELRNTAGRGELESRLDLYRRIFGLQERPKPRAKPKADGADAGLGPRRIVRGGRDG